VSKLQEFQYINFPKRKFDVKSKIDLLLFKKFMDETSWGGKPCPFIIEEPFITIPDMIKDKFCRHYLREAIRK
jgi:hypothetical protein